jgi:hypothetical protein
LAALVSRYGSQVLHFRTAKVVIKYENMPVLPLIFQV